jgi:peptide/histidine transporter 3/4
VFKNAIRRKGVAYSYDPRHYYKNDGDDKLPLMPEIFLLSRWLDKAAIIEDLSSPLSLLIEQEERGLLNTVTEVKEVKRLLTMVPMWATFFMYCLVFATGNTFFFEQTTNLDDHIQRLNFRVPETALYVAQKVSNLATAFLSNLIVNKKRFKNKILTAMKARIGVGLAFSCLCCIVAQMVEIKRLDRIKGITEHDETVGMSVFWLVPQFCLLGITQGLTEDGLLQFFYHQAPRSMKEYGYCFNNLVLGIGKFISIFWILTYRDWIRHDINDSHLENYYGILAIFSLGNLFFIYGYVSKYLYKNSYGEDPILEEAVQQVLIDQLVGHS